MNDTESLEEAVRYVRLALPLMSKHGIPITPKNYTIWYCYVSGKNKELQEAVDSIVEKAEQFSEETNKMLYQRFFAEKDENVLNKIRDNLQQTLLVVFNELAEISGQAKKYETSVSKSIDRLSENMSIQDIRNVLDEVIVVTKEIGKSGKAIQQRLKERTKKLEVLQKELEYTKTESLVDFLTGVANRKAFDEMLARSVSEDTSNDDNLCLMMIDIDNFKRFNDKHGHMVGDEVLKFVARNIKKIVRGNDFIARFGGEEFALILSETTLQGAKTVAENIRKSFAKSELERKGKSEKLGTITVSIGVTHYRPGESLEKFIKRSDKALYFAKKAGKNRVVTESDMT
ncbi:MAG: GGDEF domain-containing protein [Candidatus Scalinduaceae bacterium]